MKNLEDKKRISDVTFSEACLELRNNGADLRYRIVEVNQHLREKQKDGSLKWVDKTVYECEEIKKGFFTRCWETVIFEDEFGKQYQFEDPNEIIDWLKYKDGKQYKPIKYYE